MSWQPHCTLILDLTTFGSMLSILLLVSDVLTLGLFTRAIYLRYLQAHNPNLLYRQLHDGRGLSIYIPIPLLLEDTFSLFRFGTLAFDCQ
ncbi:hypothetical protein F5B22DRAFT_427966 [Xylaria bambusicola]|uniref:uncharacterized protein n=1 Tax=Xylaria bambusicola TaxID=326684 RepID=UPI002008BEF5|nr:uncharacterized protein F5B22DRAFT_427966 [Xylaria bambusicola]KAI0506911.1 hypothetical protein F5B22DRAFT_427966 [Xylaria bambusicola]